MRGILQGSQNHSVLEKVTVELFIILIVEVLQDT